VSEDAISIWREEVVALKDIFVEVVANGREMSKAAVQELATGRTWLADQARELNLIDTVENFDETLSRLADAG
jgi:protease-4